MMPRLCLLALIGTIATIASADPTWEVRYAHLVDQTEEWTALGRVPGWEVTIGEGEAPEIGIGGDEEGSFRGIVLVGRRWTVPEDRRARVAATLEYQTFCTMSEAPYERSGDMKLAALTPERWEQFAEEPAQAEIWNTGSERDGVLMLTTVHPNGQDVTEWEEWQTPDIMSGLRARAGEKVVLAIVWSAYHFQEEWAKVRDFELTVTGSEETEREFLEAINPEYPGLEAFGEAMRAGDVAAAKLAFVEHMRTRAEPAGPVLVTEASAGVIARADEVLENIFRSASCPPTKIDWPIQWNEDPHNYDQWAIHLNRHNDWVTLGRAYAATGDEKYAEKFVALLNSWVDAMPVHIGARYVQGPYFEPGRAHLTLDGGIRMAHTWWPAYYYFRDSPSFDAESQLRMMRSFYDHGIYLMNPDYFRVESNWGAMEANGLIHVAAMLPEMRDAPVWLATARERLVALLKAQVYQDGAQMELAPGYHGVTLSNLLGAAEVAERTGTELPSELISGLEKMFEYYAAIAMPNGRTPNVNDSGYGSVAGYLRRGLALFPERAQFEYASSQGASGEAPAYESTELPWAGWNVMRTGWAPEDRYLFFETGPFGSGHQHEDKLGIIAHVAGQTVLPEAGVYSYDRSEWRKYVLGTRAHNTVMVDGLEQNRRAVPETRVATEAGDARWFSDDEFDFAQGVYDDGYGPENAVKVSHERQVLFVKPDYWIVCDLMTPADDAEHSYEAIFHLDGENAEVDEATGAVTVSFAGGEFRVVPVGEVRPEVEIVQGQTEPNVQGWLPTGRHNELRPIPTAVFRWSASGASAVAFALVPREADDDWPVLGAAGIEADGEALAAAVELADGGRDVFVRAWGGEFAVAGVCRGDAQAAMVRLTAEGAVRAAFGEGGSGLELVGE